jgi:hypothetical protein
MVGTLYREFVEYFYSKLMKIVNPKFIRTINDLCFSIIIKVNKFINS